MGYIGNKLTREGYMSVPIALALEGYRTDISVCHPDGNSNQY